MPERLPSEFVPPASLEAAQGESPADLSIPLSSFRFDLARGKERVARTWGVWATPNGCGVVRPQLVHVETNIA